LTTGNINALADYDALSAIPAYLTPTPTLTSAATAAPEETSSLSTTSIPSTGSGPVRSLVNAVTSALPGGGGNTGAGTQSPQSFAPQVQQMQPQVEEIKQTETVPDNSGSGSQNLTRESKKFTPESIGDSPILFGSGTPGGEGMRGYGSFLKKIGLGGEESSSGDTGTE
jgi:hypothetical protein